MGWGLLILFMIIVLIVWISLINNAKKYKPDFDVQEHDDRESAKASENFETAEQVSVQSTAVKDEKEFLSELGETTRSVDDLTIIEGIGPKVSRVLNQSGIFTLEDLSVSDPQNLKEILENAKLAFMDPSTWAAQAKMAVEGEDQDLMDMQARLKGGRKTG